MFFLSLPHIITNTFKFLIYRVVNFSIMPRITRNNTVDENEIRIDESKVGKASKLVANNSELTNDKLNEVA